MAPRFNHQSRLVAENVKRPEVLLTTVLLNAAKPNKVFKSNQPNLMVFWGKRGRDFFKNEPHGEYWNEMGRRDKSEMDIVVPSPGMAGLTGAT